MTNPTDSEDDELRIETDSLDVTLRGEGAEVARAYEALREVLAEHFAATLANNEQTKGNEQTRGEPAERDEPEPRSDRLGAGTTDPLHRSGDSDWQSVEEWSSLIEPSSSVEELDDGPASPTLIVRSERQNKAYLIDRDEFDASFLGRALDADHLQDVYVDGAIEERLREEFHFGETVWRALTPTALDRVESDATQLDDTGDWEESDE